MKDPVLTSLAHLLHRTSQYADERFAAACGSDALTARQFIVLDAVATLDRPSQIEICEKSGIDRSTLADMVRRLTARGLISRRRTREDARRYALKLTDEGRQILERAAQYSKVADAHVSAALTPQQCRQLTSALRLILSAAAAGGAAADGKNGPLPRRAANADSAG